jgi:hypothetical protein
MSPVELPSKLQLPPAASVGLRRSPDDLTDAILGERPQVDPSEAEAVVVFVATAGELDKETVLLVDATTRKALTWVAYPKAGQLGTDLNRDVIRETLETSGLRTVRQVALNDVWSALRLAGG